MGHFQWLLLNGKMEKVKKSNLENSANVQKQPPEMLYNVGIFLRIFKIIIATAFFMGHFQWLLLNGKMEKVKKSNLENSANVQKQPPEMLYKKSLIKWGKI